jgi:hypothetical protein
VACAPIIDLPGIDAYSAGVALPGIAIMRDYDACGERGIQYCVSYPDVNALAVNDEFAFRWHRALSVPFCSRPVNFTEM